LGTVAKSALAVGAGAAAVRYGGAGLKAGAKMVRRGVKSTGGLSTSNALKIAGGAVSATARGVKSQVKRDVSAVGTGIGKAYKSVGGVGGVRRRAGNAVQGLGQRIGGS
jgi:hypothetical protein